MGPPTVPNGRGTTHGTTSPTSSLGPSSSDIGLTSSEASSPQLGGATVRQQNWPPPEPLNLSLAQPQGGSPAPTDRANPVAHPAFLHSRPSSSTPPLPPRNPQQHSRGHDAQLAGPLGGSLAGLRGGAIADGGYERAGRAGGGAGWVPSLPAPQLPLPFPLQGPRAGATAVGAALAGCRSRSSRLLEYLTCGPITFLDYYLSQLEGHARRTQQMWDHAQRNGDAPTWHIGSIGVIDAPGWALAEPRRERARAAL
eukprot:gene31122-54912_t